MRDALWLMFDGVTAQRVIIYFRMLRNAGNRTICCEEQLLASVVDIAHILMRLFRSVGIEPWTDGKQYECFASD
jgi:hypothetical protein